MKIFLKILKRIAFITVTIFLIILGFRTYNYLTYSKYRETDKTSIYTDPTNLDLYPETYEGIRVEHIEGDYLNGFHLHPKEKTKKGVVITFGGSEGSPGYYEGIRFASEGYEVLSLFSYGMPNQQPTLSKIPLDFFDEVLTYIDTHISDPTPITVYGGSKGAELGLNLVNYYPEIDHLILMAPSAYNFNGLDYENLASSWTYEGKELPYVTTMKASFPTYLAFMVGMITGTPISYEGLYRTAVDNTEDLTDKTILQKPVEVDMLIFAGGKDRMWPSASMAKAIKSVQGDRAQVHIYNQAGHIFSGDGYIDSPYGLVATGGTKTENTAAGKDYQTIIMETLTNWHK